MFFHHEFYSNRVLQAALAVCAFIYFVAFYQWIRNSAVSTTAVADLTYRCPVYLQNCEWLYFLTNLPFGHSQTIWYMFMFGALAWVVYLLTEKRWQEACLVLLIPYLWHAANVFLLTDLVKSNYEYYVFFFTTIILFFPHKEFFAKLLIVLLYVLSTFAKIHPAWIAGSYFTNLQLGLPLVPDAMIPVATNIVILMEMVGAWFLLSKHPILQRTVFAFFVFFHLYSGILVEYRYPATVLPMLVILFGPWYRWSPVPFTKRSLIGWGLVVLMIGLQISPKLIPGDEKLTLEGNSFGLYMFESNHQCISTATYHLTDGTAHKDVIPRMMAANRCDPYRDWFRHQQICERDPNIARISWQFDHSINGDDFLRIVDTEDSCSLEYQPFVHNEWIKTHADNPASVGKPAKNLYD